MSNPSLLEVHGALSTLVFAVTKTLEPMLVDVTAQWRNGTYLSLQIECRARNKQAVIDRLLHGALFGEYDYRFTLSYPTMPEDPNDWTTVTAYPDMCRDHDAKKIKKAA